MGRGAVEDACVRPSVSTFRSSPSKCRYRDSGENVVYLQSNGLSLIHVLRYPLINVDYHMTELEIMIFNIADAGQVSATDLQSRRHKSNPETVATTNRHSFA